MEERQSKFRGYVIDIVRATAASLACMALFVAVVLVIPATAPIVLFGAAIATVVGLRVIKSGRSDTFLPELLFSIAMGILNLLIALQVMWTVGAIDL